MSDIAAAPAAPSSTGGTPAPAAPAPTTFAQAFAAEASPPSDPSTPASASPEGPAAAPEVTPGETTREPFIPRARFDEVNTRLKTAEEQVKSVQAALGGVDARTAKEAIDWMRQHASDPEGFLVSTALDHTDPVALFTKIATALQQHPQHRQALASYAAKQLAAQRGQQEPQPDVQYQLGDGRTILLYSAEQQAKRDAWLHKQISAEYDERIAPLVQEQQARLKAEQARQADVASQQWVSTTVQDTLSWPGMDQEAHRVALSTWVGERVNGRAISGHQMERLIDQAYRTVVLPKLTASAESSVLDTLQQKAQAATGVSPGSAAPTTTKRIDSFKDKSLRW